MRDLLSSSTQPHRRFVKQELFEEPLPVISIDSQLSLHQALSVMEKRHHPAIAITQEGLIKESFSSLPCRFFVFLFSDCDVVFSALLPSAEGKVRIAKQVIGIISEAMLARAIFEKKDLDRVRCREVVSAVPFATPDNPVDELAILMLEQNLTAVPVVDQAALILDFKHLVSSF